MLPAGITYKTCFSRLGPMVLLLLLRLQVPGVVGFYSAKDVPGSNMIGPVWTDEEVFAVEEVTAVGQVRGLVD